MTKAQTAISDAAISNADFARQALRFVRDFADFAGTAGVWGAVLSFSSAAFESVGLVLLVPLLSIVTATNDSPGWIHKSALRILDLTGAETRTARLATLLGLFAILIVLRAIVTARRDMTLSQLQMGFVEQIERTSPKSLPRRPGRRYRDCSMRG